MKTFLVAMALTAVSSIAAQAGDHAYIQLNAGSFGSDMSNCTTSWTDSSGTVVATYSSSAGQVDCNRTKGPSGKLVVGYQIVPAFALEATYWKFGTEYSLDPVGKLNSKISAFGLGGALHFGITDNWSGVGRFGFARVKSKLSSQVNGAAVIDGSSDSHAKYYVGAGVAYAVTPMLKLHGDFDYTKTRAGSLLTGSYVSEHGIHLLSAGASLNF